MPCLSFENPQVLFVVKGHEFFPMHILVDLIIARDCLGIFNAIF
jgi:hypothetical protein